MQLARKHGAGGGRHTDAVEELKNAFELAERSSPGITNRFCRIVDGFLLQESEKKLVLNSLSLSGLSNRCCRVCSRVCLRLDWPPRLKILGGDFCPSVKTLTCCPSDLRPCCCRVNHLSLEVKSEHKSDLLEVAGLANCPIPLLG